MKLDIFCVGFLSDFLLVKKMMTFAEMKAVVRTRARDLMTRMIFLIDSKLIARAPGQIKPRQLMFVINLIYSYLNTDLSSQLIKPHFRHDIHYILNIPPKNTIFLQLSLKNKKFTLIKQNFSKTVLFIQFINQFNLFILVTLFLYFHYFIHLFYLLYSLILFTSFTHFIYFIYLHYVLHLFILLTQKS